MSRTFVTLAEVLEARGGPLVEDEVWSLLLGAAESLLGLAYKAQGSIITPSSMLLSGTGMLAFKNCALSDAVSMFTAPEMLQGRQLSTKCAIEKVAVYSLGMTLYWSVDYHLPQDQPIQLSDALNSLLLGMCEDLAHRRPNLTSTLEACQLHHSDALLPPPGRLISQLVEDLLQDHVESASLSDGGSQLGSRSQMIRKRLHGKCGIYTLYNEENKASRHLRRLSSDSDIQKGGLCQHRVSAPKGTFSPPHCYQSLPHRIVPGLRQQGSSCWLSHRPYLSSQLHSTTGPLSPSISVSQSCTSLASQRRAKTLGPEFARMVDEAVHVLELPGSIVSKKGKSCASQREVYVVLPNDQSVAVKCDINSKGRDVFDMVVAHANLVEHFYFGLAFIDDGEFFFLDSEMKISKVAPDSWKKLPTTPFTLYLRVKFFPDDVSFILHRLTRHQYYLQLRKDILEDRLQCNNDTALFLSALALQAEFGDYMPEVYGKNYFQVEHYVSKKILEKMVLPSFKEELLRLHANNAQMLPEEAETEFLKFAQQLPEYGVLFHRVGRDRKTVSGDLLLGVCSKGLIVFDVMNSTRFINRCFYWSETDSISTSRRKITIECGPSGKKHSFVTETSKIAQYLLNLCSAQHKFHSEMNSRQLTHTLTSDEILDKFSPQHPQLKQMSCSEVVLNNVGLNTMPRQSISKSCDDLTAKMETQFRDQREQRQGSSSPKMLHCAPSGESLQKQDSEAVSVTFSACNTPTQPPPEREIICVTLKKDPELGFGFIIVGQDNTGKLDLGIFIASIVPDGPADKDGRIRPGGRLISLNKTSLEGVTFNIAASILQNSPDEVELIVSQPKLDRRNRKVSLGVVLERSYDSQTTLSSEFHPGMEELEDALTAPKVGKCLHIPVVRILDAQDGWSQWSSSYSLREGELLTVELLKRNGSLGISVAGGVGTSTRHGGTYIKSLLPGGSADLDGRIQTGDRLLEVNGANVRSATHRQAVECLKSTGEVVTLLLERVQLDNSSPSSSMEHRLSSSLCCSSTSPRTNVSETLSLLAKAKEYYFVSDGNTLEVTLMKNMNSLGFSFLICELRSPPFSVVRIKRLFPGQPAQESGVLQEGDVILAVNGVLLNGMSYQKVLHLLRGSPVEVQLSICRPAQGMLPDLDTSSLSPSNAREMRSRSLDLRMTNISHDFSQLLLLKVEEKKRKMLENIAKLENTAKLDSQEKDEMMNLARVRPPEFQAGSDSDPSAGPSSPSSPESSSEAGGHEHVEGTELTEVTRAPQSVVPQEPGESNTDNNCASPTLTSDTKHDANSSTYCMVSNGLAFLATEDYLAVASVSSPVQPPAHPSSPTLLPHTPTEGWLQPPQEVEDEEDEDPRKDVLKEFELNVRLTKSWSGSFGFTITRSRIDGCYYVQDIVDNPAKADGRLRAGDRLIMVNGCNVTLVSDDVAMSILRSSSKHLNMVLGRAVQNLIAPPPPECLPDIILHKTPSGQLGIKLTGGIGSKWQGIYVVEVVPNSPASEEGSIQPNDKILYICGKCTMGMSLEDAVKSCENTTHKVKLKALREDQPVTPKAKWNGACIQETERFGSTSSKKEGSTSV
ncbi:tyrosine-protein phosphatase non-receptor type 13-like isoform X1 [Denticeps clupeoides]|uniref:tyrosine-protein phosphatase non-receptor type 13-like isoform X1 n=1 Tax=Denticeps clupeoides TaxID=299321 RepID=UPI0010A4CE7E|nr:tyrosine-protein phosphatase non-receptor type 13-like isoform X1 [Denticeps clupeoides]XP_028821882.1 tyrosine-protein phosphatase non-receptor type 13-like isoform X1 [Denticeps clupeoides]